MLPTLKFYPDLLKKYLKARGFNTVQEYQHFHGLTEDGEPGTIFSRHIQTPRICAHPDNYFPPPSTAIHFAQYGYFPSGYTIKWGFRSQNDLNRLPSLSSSGWTTSYKEALEVAFNRWSKHLNISFQYSSGQDLNWMIQTGPIDGPSGTLAWAELPPVADFKGTLNQKIDSRERLIASDDPNPPSGLIDIVRVMCHEGGHSLGLGHMPTGRYPGALLNPMYGTVIYPQSHDINELLKVYEPATVTDPNPDPNPDPGDNDRIICYQGNKHGVALPFSPVRDPKLFEIKWVQ